jgi:hypothetical protein
MANDDKPKPDLEAGLKALTTPRTRAEQVTDSSDYGKTPMPGIVAVPCKNTKCTAAVESGFVWNMEEWIAGFLAKEYTCPACNSTARYSREDVVPLPSKR